MHWLHAFPRIATPPIAPSAFNKKLMWFTHSMKAIWPSMAPTETDRLNLRVTGLGQGEGAHMCVSECLCLCLCVCVGREPERGKSARGPHQGPPPTHTSLGHSTH